MASLAGEQLKDTYDSLLKLSDNDALTLAYKEVTDGEGAGTNLYVGTDGNVGIGTTNIANNSDYSALRLGATASMWAYNPTINGNLFINENITAQDGDYIRSDFATSYRQGDGTHKWYNAPSGTAGTSVSLTERMRIEADGDIAFYDDANNQGLFWDASTARLGLGTDSPGTVLDIHGTGNVLHVGTGTNVAQYMSFRGSGASGAYIGYDGVGMLLQAGDGKRFRIKGGNTTFNSGSTGLEIDTSGNVGIGTSPTDKLDVFSSSNNQRLIRISHPTSPTEASGFLGFNSDGTTDNNLVTLGVQYSNTYFNALNIQRSTRYIGIGTTSPDAPLTVAGPDGLGTVPSLGTNKTAVFSNANASADGVQVYLLSGNAGSSALYFGDTDDADVASIQYNHSSNYMAFETNDNERLRIDSSGTVLVGKTTADNTTAGVTMYGSIAPGSVSMVRDSGNVLILNRLTDSGDVLVFRHDSVGFGQVAEVAGLLCIGSSNNVALTFTSSAIRPSNNNGSGRDNAIDLGQSGNRFQDIYATNGTIQTSDVNEKQDIEELDDAELRVAQQAKTLLRKFRWKSSVEEKGDDARIHFGIIAQDLEQAFTDEGLDAGRYGMFIKSTWTNEDGEEQTRLGVRYNQLLAFIISSI